MADESHPLTIAVASRPHPFYEVNGDRWCAHSTGTTCRIAVIDGLGHGPEAAIASERACAALDAAPDLTAGDSLLRCHDALAGTRGAAVAIARMVLATRDLTIAAVGNVETQVWNGERIRRPIVHRGIVGRMLPRARDECVPLISDDWLLLLYSDGIRDRFELETLPEFIQRDAQGLADSILNEWSRDTDDATVVVVTPRLAS